MTPHPRYSRARWYIKRWQPAVPCWMYLTASGLWSPHFEHAHLYRRYRDAAAVAHGHADYITDRWG